MVRCDNIYMSKYIQVLRLTISIEIYDVSNTYPPSRG